MAAQRLGAQRSPPALSTETPRLPQEAPDALLPLLHGEASQIRQASPRNEQPGSHQDPVQEIQGASREEKGTGWGWGGGGGDGSSCLSSSPSTTGTARLLPGLGVTRRCFSPVGPVGPALLPRAAGWGWRWRLRPSVRPFQTALGGGVAVGWAVLGSPPRSGGAGRPCWRWDGRLGSVCRQQQKGRGAKSSVPLAHGRRLARAARGTGQEVGMPSCLPAWEGASGSSAGAAAL